MPMVNTGIARATDIHSRKGAVKSYIYTISEEGGVGTPDYATKLSLEIREEPKVKKKKKRTGVSQLS